MKKHKHKELFDFDIEFQREILRYTATDKFGYKALDNYTPDHFSTIELSVIAHGFKTYYKQKKTLPKSQVVFLEHLRKLYHTADYKDLLSEDKKEIQSIVKELYSSPAKDGEEILQAVAKFNSYIKLKNTLESLNLKDFGQYENFSTKVRDAINIAVKYKKDRPIFLLAEAGVRIKQRSTTQDVYPLPFWQMNKHINAGGYNKGSLVVFLGPEKYFKTLTLINFSKNYLKRKKKILYIDLENGQEGIALRAEQTLTGYSKEEVLSQEHNAQLLKTIRKYKRLGGEIVIKRMAAYTTTTKDIQNLIDDIYREHGIRFDILVVDYVVLLASLSNKTNDTERISDAYIDLKNLTESNNFEICLTGHHITREGKSRLATRYHPNDTAKCIDVNRHVDAIWGIQQNEEESQNGVIRLEIITQRDGDQSGRAYFWINPKIQKLTEFNKSQLDEIRKVTERDQPTVTPEIKRKQKNNDI